MLACGVLLRVCQWLITAGLVRIWDLLCIARLAGLWDTLKMVLQGQMIVIFLVAAAAFIFHPLRLESLALPTIIIDRWRDTMELEAYASRTWPGIRCRRIAFDLASSASLARSHHYRRSVMAPKAHNLTTNPSGACGDCARQRRHSLDAQVSDLRPRLPRAGLGRTLLDLARAKVIRGEREVLDLRTLR